RAITRPPPGLAIGCRLGKAWMLEALGRDKGLSHTSPNASPRPVDGAAYPTLTALKLLHH
ncbi:hypothetical protein, partial [Tateyamaria sp.]|uniref:hypothetical protein n=1 Tax=Tateyamaria sp. TaxID=1929288 RepID=UPI0032A0B1F0